MNKRVSRAVAYGVVALPLLGGVAVGVPGCSGEFDTSRTVPARATIGRELYGVACDRVGAQALHEDVTGASFRALCHPDAAGVYADKVNVGLLVAIAQDAKTPEGDTVPVATQLANRKYRIARIEALAKRREELVRALDAALPDVKLPKIATSCADSGRATASVSVAAATTQGTPFRSELADTLSRIVDLYGDDAETVPTMTRALGHTLDDVKADPDVQTSLTRFDARQGYRPLPVALGLARPVLAYPQLPSLARALMQPLVTPPDGATAVAFDAGLRVLHNELRTPRDVSTATGPLTTTADPKLDGRTVLSRPRTFLEAMREVLLLERPEFVVPSGSGLSAATFVARRDGRGYAQVAREAASLPSLFVDRTGGANGGPDGLADVDDLGQFITATGAPPPSPFFSVGAQDGARDGEGRALAGAPNTYLYDYIDARQTFLAKTISDAARFFTPDATHQHETAMNLVSGLAVLAGARDENPVAVRLYPPERLATDAPVSVAYRAFHPETSPLVDLVHGVGQILGDPAVDHTLALFATIAKDHPEALASLVGLGLEIKAIADRHPEATVPATYTFYDDLLKMLATVSKEPGLLEDIVRAFAEPDSLGLEHVLETYFAFKDETSYDRNDLNGPSINFTTNGPLSFVTKVDRTKPDSGKNRSVMQKFFQLLHDTNGLAICTKDDAIVHIKTNIPGTALPVAFDYPSDRFYSPLVCGIVGSTAPAHLGKCQVFGYQNVMTLLLDVILEKAQLTVRDPCLDKLMKSSLAQWAGGADNFLQSLSGVQGFSLHPNLRGFSRLLYFETPFPGLPTDTNPKNAQTSLFLKDTIEPIPSMACPVAPFTDLDGTVFPLRNCGTVNDTLRARDPNSLFPVDELGFVKSLKPLATAFQKHNLPLLFANLFDVLHLHWGSASQTTEECDPKAPHTDGRWCSQDGLVTYEPLLVEVLNSRVFERLQNIVRTIQATKVHHCNSYDAKGLCTDATDVDGTHVIGELLTMMLNADRTPGLTDAHGNTLALRNDGTRAEKITAMHVVVDALKGVDKAFASYAAATPNDADRQRLWRAARSELVDTYLTVKGQGAAAQFANPSLMPILPKLFDVVRAQILARCHGDATSCTWAKRDLEKSFSDVLSGPSFAAAVDLIDAVRKDDGARTELEKLITYLLDLHSDNDALGGALSAATDLLQVLEDDTNLTPFERLVADASGPAKVDAQGKITQRSLVDGSVRALARIFEQPPPGQGGACSNERDPNGAIPELLANLVTPMGNLERAPLEVIIDVMADVNRATPGASTKLTPQDYGNISNELSDFMLNGSSGLEQIYSTLNNLTRKPGAP